MYKMNGNNLFSWPCCCCAIAAVALTWDDLSAAGHPEVASAPTDSSAGSGKERENVRRPAILELIVSIQRDYFRANFPLSPWLQP